MTTSSVLGVYHLLLMAYVLLAVSLNLLAYLISDFYRKKFNHPAPRGGFLTAIVLCVALALSSTIRDVDAPLAEAIQNILMFAAGVVSLYSSISLYFTMKKVRR